MSRKSLSDSDNTLPAAALGYIRAMFQSQLQSPTNAYVKAEVRQANFETSWQPCYLCQRSELIFDQTGLYAAFEPTLHVELGDYGHVEECTGEFFAEGNIFDKKEGEKSLAERLGIESVEKKISGPKFHRIASKRVAAGERKHDAYGVTPTAEKEVRFDGSLDEVRFDIRFKRGGAAALFFPHGTERMLQREIRLLDSSNPHRGFLDKKAIVTRVWTAPTYAMFMSKVPKRFSLYFRESVPVASSSGMKTIVGGNVSSTFRVKDISDHFELGPPFCMELSQANPTRFCPLFRLAHATRDWIPDLEEVESAPKKYLDTLELPDYPSPWVGEDAESLSSDEHSEY